MAPMTTADSHSTTVTATAEAAAVRPCRRATRGTSVIAAIFGQVRRSVQEVADNGDHDRRARCEQAEGPRRGVGLRVAAEVPAGLADECCGATRDQRQPAPEGDQAEH